MTTMIETEYNEMVMVGIGLSLIEEVEEPKVDTIEEVEEPKVDTIEEVNLNIQKDKGEELRNHLINMETPLK